MRYFDIYLMKEEIARLYLGREDLLYRLFLETKMEKQPYRKNILRKQVRYITEPITFSLLKSLLFTQPIVRSAKNKCMIGQKDGSIATLTFDDGYISLKASGEYSAETAVFEVLRHGYSHFFAVDYQNKCGAWLSPQKKHILHQRQLVL